MTWTVSVTADTLEAALALIKGTPAPPPVPVPPVPPKSQLTALIAAAPSGTLMLSPGELHDTAPLPKAIALIGAGMGTTVIDCTGITPTDNKAVLVVKAAGCAISDMTLKGANISAALGQNAAGVRDNGPNVGFTLRRVEVFGCQNGILTFASNITLDACIIHENGAGVDGHTHEVYFEGLPGTTVTVMKSTITCGKLSTHALKSRAGTTNVTSSKLLGAPAEAGGNGGSVIDIPNGGLVTITDTDIALATGAANHMFIGFGMEATNMANAATGSTVTLSGVRLHGNGFAGSIETKIPNAKLVIGPNCTFDGTVPPSLVGWAAGSISGAFRPA